MARMGTHAASTSFSPEKSASTRTNEYESSQTIAEGETEVWLTIPGDEIEEEGVIEIECHGAARTRPTQPPEVHTKRPAMGQRGPRSHSSARRPAREVEEGTVHARSHVGVIGCHVTPAHDLPRTVQKSLDELAPRLRLECILGFRIQAELESSPL
ncbi:hypothetical protein EDB89DRAFT_1910947 [Lactarius sanguifluus]|nr:hypothetical protein EDB89DRAFT_1910947 [Lactarius sanguifluus]